jgi:hypothetical protein
VKDEVPVDFDDVLRLVGERSYAILHSRNLRIGITWALPIIIGSRLLLAFLVEPPEAFRGGILDSRSLGQLVEVYLIVLARVLAEDALHRRVGFKCRRVDSDRLAADQSLLSRQPQHPTKDLVVNLSRKTLTTAGQCRRVWRLFGQHNAEELA